jgi:hypothetical protein
VWLLAQAVRIALDDELRTRTRAAISDLRLAAASGRAPPPLVDVLGRVFRSTPLRPH